MASLSEKQAEFTVAIGSLILWAFREGYRLTFGDAYATSGHKDNSFHYKRLAIDLNLFIYNEENGKWEYQESTEAHAKIGAQWKKMGGTWGGDFRKKDGNHYSWGE